MIDKEKIRVGLNFVMGLSIYEIISIDKKDYARTKVIAGMFNPAGSINIVGVDFIKDYCIEVPPETPEQKGKRETDYTDKVLQDIEQFELDNIEYLRDQIQEKINRIR